MRATTLQINLIILVVILAILQGVILWFVNGALQEMVSTHDAVGLGIVFSPTVGIVWAMKRMAFYQNKPPEDPP